jgi:hypothetical protein
MNDIARHINARLHADCCGENLCSFYADQLAITGTKTTAEDALSAWSRWLDAQGGKPERPLKVSDWTNGFHERVAAMIREVARYPIAGA